MPHSINIRSDDLSSNKLRDLWTLCGRLEGIPSMHSLGYPPHFTLAIFDNAREPQLIDAMHSLAPSLSHVTVRFDRISYFDAPNSIVLWAAPADPESLAELHMQVHERLNSESCRPNYQRKIWVPHCSLAVGIDPKRRDEAMAIVQTDISPFEVVFDVIDCARFHPVKVVYERRLSSAS